MTVVLLDVGDFAATVTLHRPEKRNALSGELLSELRRTLKELDAREDVRAIVLTGSDPAFCAGLDLMELGEPGSSLGGSASGRAIPELSKPLIGAINGVAVTGGLELALACDFLIASERARFADTHARMGIMPGWGLTVDLPAAVGLRRAREMSATGNFIDAHTALQWGLVNHVVAHDELVAFARKLATDAASTEQAAMKRILATYNEGSQGTGSEARDLEARVHRNWHAAGIDAAHVSQRRDAVIARGRAQG